MDLSCTADLIAKRNRIIYGLIAPVRENEWVTERNKIVARLMKQKPELAGYDALAIADEEMRRACL